MRSTVTRRRDVGDARLLGFVGGCEDLVLGLEQIRVPCADQPQEPELRIAVGLCGAVGEDVGDPVAAGGKRPADQDAPVALQRVALGAQERYAPAGTTGLHAPQSLTEFR